MVAISKWNNVDSEGVTVQWDLGGPPANYRWAGEGKFDVTIVDVDAAGVVTKTWPRPDPETYRKEAGTY